MSAAELVGTIFKLVFAFMFLAAFLGGLIGAFLLLRDQRRELRNLDGFARGIKRIRDDEKRMDPAAPSVLRLLAPTKHLGE